MPNAYANATLIGQRSGITYTDLGLADQAALDAFILSLNQRASAAIEDFCKRDFTQHIGAVESYDGTDDRFLDLRGWPILSITSVLDSGVALVAGTDYRQKPSTAGGEAPGILEKPDGDVWARDWDRYTVTYTWGYASPPLDVQRVAEDVVVRMLQAAKADREAAGASSLSMDGFSVSYDRSTTLATELLPEDKAALAKWRFIQVG